MFMVRPVSLRPFVHDTIITQVKILHADSTAIASICI